MQRERNFAHFVDKLTAFCRHLCYTTRKSRCGVT